jgi:hypothetical protein
MLEKTIEKYFVKTVKDMGGVAYKFSSPAHRGVSDRIAVMPNGVVWFVEIKRPGGKLTPLQEKFATDVQALGQRYACLWTKEDVDAWASR